MSNTLALEGFKPLSAAEQSAVVGGGWLSKIWKAVRKPLGQAIGSLVTKWIAGR